MLGIKINHFNDAISLDQQNFTESLIHLYRMTDCKPVATALMPNTHLKTATPDDIANFNSLNVNFRSAVGSINYLSTATRPDLCFAVSSLSQFLETPSFTHWQSFLHMLRYLKGTQNIGLLYVRNMKKEIVAYSDADWGNCSVTQRSVTGYLTTFHQCLALMKTRKQKNSPCLQPRLSINPFAILPLNFSGSFSGADKPVFPILTTQSLFLRIIRVASRQKLAMATSTIIG
ncbi:hypothetical protein O181_006687 [Austropuccinia psidii MF-1]|uniref:Reverse transcriptase Ty1/copia-type domain-containing protein n=1 Tax=Austropuccinia psidii MF-1 TaxID=1389203 RepID=A0A9Q3BKH5_9BASI|nr:hypothetical protein [Austropuccinia psidii MF-1]